MTQCWSFPGPISGVMGREADQSALSGSDGMTVEEKHVKKRLNWSKKAKLAVLLGLVICSGVKAAPPSCPEWNPQSFFQQAGLQEVADCLAARADPNARSESG